MSPYPVRDSAISSNIGNEFRHVGRRQTSEDNAMPKSTSTKKEARVQVDLVQW